MSSLRQGLKRPRAFSPLSAANKMQRTNGLIRKKISIH